MTEQTAVIFSQLGLSAIGLIALLFGALIFSSYVKVVTVLGILRAGLGFYGLPSAFVSGGLALVLTFFIMYPTIQRSALSLESSIGGNAGNISEQARVKAISSAMEEWKHFLKLHAREAEVERFVSIAKDLDQKAMKLNQGDRPRASEQYQEPRADSWRILAPAFMVSELRTAFIAGLAIFLPFLVIELLVANILTAVGMNRLSPAFVSLPIKILVFIMLDGWTLVAGNLAAAYAK